MTCFVTKSIGIIVKLFEFYICYSNIFFKVPDKNIPTENFRLKNILTDRHLQSKPQCICHIAMAGEYHFVILEFHCSIICNVY